MYQKLRKVTKRYQQLPKGTKTPTPVLQVATPVQQQDQFRSNTSLTAAQVQQQHKFSSNTSLAAMPVQQQHRVSSNTSLASTQGQQQHWFSSNTSLAATPFQQQHKVSSNISLAAAPGYAVRTICPPYGLSNPYNLSTPNQGSPYNLSPYGLSKANQSKKAVRTICLPYNLSADHSNHRNHSNPSCICCPKLGAVHILRQPKWGVRRPPPPLVPKNDRQIRIFDFDAKRESLDSQGCPKNLNIQIFKMLPKIVVLIPLRSPKIFGLSHWLLN